MNIKEAINKLVQWKDLTEAEAIEVMNEVMNGEATEAQIAAFITALRMKGETVEEITGCARVMRQFATPIPVRAEVSVDRDDINIDYETIVDTCGTGGDRTRTFNISTATAFVVAAAGVLVAKHGNRSVSSACGSADVLEELGVKLDITPEKVGQCIRQIGIGFLFAPLLHSAMKYAIGPRRQIGIRTIFNILGPLTNPAGANVQVLGVYEEKLVKMLARVLKNLGTKQAMVVHGEGCIDEISLTGPTKIAQILPDGRIKEYTIKPEDFGLKRTTIDDLRGGDARENARIIRAVLGGEPGPKQDVVALNAAAAFIVSNKAKDFSEGLLLAYQILKEKKALEKLEKLIALTNE